ncbi:MAG: TrmH family RNA methyltransferase [Actinomycetota bacterium]
MPASTTTATTTAPRHVPTPAQRPAMIIESPANDRVRAARKLARRRERARRGVFLVEGPEVLAEALAHLVEVFVAVDAPVAAHDLARAAEARGARRSEVTAAVLDSLAATMAPQGVVGVAALDEPALDEALDAASLAVLCCGVADPGNAGAIVRSADAAGADAVLLSAGSVDARNPKAVRASAGSLFHLPVVEGVDPLVALAAARERGLATLGLDAGGALAHTEADLAAPTLLVLGAEADGLPAEVAAGCDAVVGVPMPGALRPGWQGRAESLNLAATAAVALLEAARQRGAR